MISLTPKAAAQLYRVCCFFCVRPAWAWTNEVKVLCRKITVENHVVIRR